VIKNAFSGTFACSYNFRRFLEGGPIPSCFTDCGEDTWN